MADTPIELNEENQLTIEDMANGMSVEEIERLLETPDDAHTEVQSIQFSTPPAPIKATTPAKAAPKASKAPAPLQGANKKKTPMTTTTKKPTTPATPKTPAHQGWVTINPRDTAAVAKFGTEHGVSAAGIKQLQSSLMEQNFLSHVQVFDLTKQFHETDAETGVRFADFLIGAVACQTGRGGAAQRGFQFTSGVDQKVLLVKGSIYTELQVPNPVTKLMQGPAPAIFACFPETTPGVPGQKGTGGVSLLGYRPLLRVMAQHIVDGTIDGDAMNNIYFQVKTRGVGRFNDLIPNFLYEAGLKAGVTDEEFLMRETNTVEIEARADFRAKQPRNRAGYTSNGGAQGTGAVLTGFSQAARDPSARLANSVGNGFNANS